MTSSLGVACRALSRTERRRTVAAAECLGRGERPHFRGGWILRGRHDQRGDCVHRGISGRQRIGRDAMVRAVAKIVNAVSVAGSTQTSRADTVVRLPPDVTQTVEAVLDVGAVGVNLRGHGPPR